MAVVLDNLGRKLDTSNLTLAEIKNMVGNMMSKQVETARDVKEVAKDFGINLDKSPSLQTIKGDITKVREILEQYGKDWKKEVAEQKKLVETIATGLMEITKAKSDRKNPRKEKPAESKSEKVMSKSTSSLYKLFSEKGSGYVHDVHVERAIRDMIDGMDRAFGVRVPAPPAQGGGPGGTTNPPGGGGRGGGRRFSGSSDDDPERLRGGTPYNADLLMMTDFIRTITNELKNVENAILGFNTLATVLGGIEREFVQEARQMAYEVAGATKESHGLMRSFEDIGTTVKATGKDRQAFIESYQNAVKSGIRDLKVAKNLSIAQLNTEEQLGMKADALGDTFREWNKHNRMNTTQLGEMGRGLRDIARYTGMTGDALNAVVKSSQQWITQLRNAATLTANAAKNVIEIQANATKLGIAEQMGSLMKAMTSSNNLLMEASSQTKAFLLSAANSAGRVRDLMQGNILRTKEGIKDMARGMETLLKRFGVQSLEAIDQLTDDAKFRLNLQLKAAFGLELGEVRSTIEALKESGKGLADRLEDINKKRKQNLTLEEKSVLMEEERKLKTSKSLEMLTALDEAAKGASDMNQALAKFGDRRKDFEGDLSALGMAWTTEAGVARNAIQMAMDNVNVGLKKAGKQELTIDSTEIENALKDPAAMRELTAKITRGEQEMAVAQKAQLDPMNQMSQYLREINDNIRNYTNSLFSKMFNSLIGKVLVIAAAIAGLTAGIALMGIDIMSKVDTFSRTVGRMTERGWTKTLLGVFSRNKGGETAATATANGGPEPAPKEEKELKTALVTGHKSEMKAGQDCCAAITEGLNAVVKAIQEGVAQIIKSLGKTEVVAQDKPQVAAALAGVAAKKEVSGKEFEDPAVVKAKLKKINEDKSLDRDPAKKKAMMNEVVAQRKDFAMQKKDLIMQKKDWKSLKQGDKIQDAQQGLVQQQQNITAEQAKKGPCPQPPSSDCFDIQAMLSAGKEMAKVAAAVIILTVGVLALGAALVFLSKKLISMFGLDLKTVLETVAVVAAIGVAGAAIAVAAIGVYKALEDDETKKFVDGVKLNYGQILKIGAAIALIAPAMVFLGGMVVFLVHKMTQLLGLNLGTVAETAIAVGAVIGAAAVIIGGINEASKSIEEMKDSPLMKNAGEFRKLLWKGGKTLMLLAPAITLLAVAVVWACSKILAVTGVDAMVAAKTGMHIAAIIVAAGFIAGAVMGASAALYGLGLLSEKVATRKNIGKIMKGATTLSILAPLITLLASSVVYFCKKIMSVLGVDAAVAGRTGVQVAAIITAAGFIAGAVMGASAALYGLGLLSNKFLTRENLSKFVKGAAALVILAPLITLLATSVVYFCKKIMSAMGIDAGVAAKTGMDVAGIIAAAGFIALAVMGATWALNKLGEFIKSNFSFKFVGYALLGAAAFAIITPAVLTLAVAVLNMAKGITDAAGIDLGEAKDIGLNVAGVILSAAVIAGAVLAAGAGLAMLGKLVLTGLFWWFAKMAALGALALLILTPAVVGLATAVVGMSSAIMKMGVNPSDAIKVAEDLGKVLGAAATIAGAVLAGSATMAIFGALWPVAWFIIGMMYLGLRVFKKMAPAIAAISLGIIAFGKAVVSAAGGLKRIKPLIEGIQAISDAIKAVGGIFDTLYNTIMPLVRKPWFGLFVSSKLEELSSAIPKFQASFEHIIDFFKNGVIRPMKKTGRITKEIKQTTQTAKMVAEAIKSVGTIMDTVAKVVLPLATKPWYAIFSSTKLDQLSSAIPKFEASFDKVLNFVKGGVIRPLLRAFKETKQVKQAAMIGKAVGDAMNAIIPMMDNISKVVVGLTEKPSFLWFSTGPSQLQKLEEALPKFDGVFRTITNFIKRGILNPLKSAFPSVKQVSSVIPIAKGIGEGVTAIVQVMDILANKLAPMTKSKGMLWWKKAPQLTEIGELAGKFEAPFRNIVVFVRDALVGVIVSAFPDIKAVEKVMPIIEGVGKAISSITEMMDSLVNTLLPMAEQKTSGWLFWKETKDSDFDRLLDMVPTIQGAFTKIVSFVKNGLIGPVEAAFPDLKKAEQGVKTVDAMGKAIDAVIGIVESITSLNELINPLGVFAFLFQQADETTTPLEKSIPTIKRVFESITNFIKEGLVKPISGLDANGLNQTVKKIQLTSKALGLMTELVEDFQSMMGLLKPKTGLLWYAAAMGDKLMETEADKLETESKAIQKVFSNITNFVRDAILEPVKGLGTYNLKGSVKSLTTMAKAMDGMMDLVESFQEMMGLTKPDAGLPYFAFVVAEQGNTKADKLVAAIDPIQNVMKSIVTFIEEGVLKPIKGLEGYDMKKSLKTVSAMGKIMTRMDDILESFRDMMGMASPSGLVSFAEAMKGEIKTEATKMKDSVEPIKEVMTSVISFITDAVIQSVKGFESLDLKKTVRTITAVSKMMGGMSTIITSLDKVMSLMSPGDKMNISFPMDRIKSSMEWFENWFGKIATFVKKTLIQTVDTEFGDIKSVESTTKTLTALTCMVSQLAPLIDGLDKAVSKMSPGDYINISFPIDRIKESIKWFEKWFPLIGSFIKKTIVDEVKSTFGDPAGVQDAAKILTAVASVTSKLAPVIENLDKAMSKMSPGDKLDITFPMDRIKNSKDWFTLWFKQIGEFVRDGIVGEINKIFPDTKGITKAARVMGAMSSIVTKIPKVIKGLSQAMALMGDEKNFDDDFPMDRIMLKKDVFADYFKKIAIFIKDGIVNAILGPDMPQPDRLMKAAKSMSAMAKIITLIPPVIKNMAKNLIPLVDSGDDIEKSAPMEAIIENKDIFKDWFTQVAIFMRDGIVKPILDELKDTKQVSLAAKLLNAMSVVLTTLPKVIRNVSRLFVPLDPKKCLAESPVGTLAKNTPQFSKWFWTVASFMREGIIDPIYINFPDKEEVVEIADILENMNKVVGMLPGFLFGLAAKLNELTTAVDGKISPLARVAGDVSKYATAFYNIADMLLGGIINPIRQFPDGKEIEIIKDKLFSVGLALDQLPEFLDMVGEKMETLLSAGWRNTFVSLKVEEFAPYFWNLTNSLNEGVIKPMKDLPDAKALEEMNGQIHEIGVALDQSLVILDMASVAMEKFSGGWWWRITQYIKMNNFADYFRIIALAITEGILKPVKTFFPETKEMEAAITQMDTTVKLLDKMGDLLDSMSRALTRLSRTKLDFSPLSSVDFSPLSKLTELEMGLRQPAMERIFDRSEIKNMGESGTVEANKISPVPQPQPASSELQRQIEQHKASTKPTETKVVSHELESIADESSQQTKQNAMIIKLLQAMLKCFTPQPEKVETASADLDTASKKVNQRPPNYYKRASGRHNQTPGRSILNIGPQVI